MINVINGVFVAYILLAVILYFLTVQRTIKKRIMKSK